MNPPKALQIVFTKFSWLYLFMVFVFTFLTIINLLLLFKLNEFLKVLLGLVIFHVSTVSWSIKIALSVSNKKQTPQLNKLHCATWTRTLVPLKGCFVFKFELIYLVLKHSLFFIFEKYFISFGFIFTWFKKVFLHKIISNKQIWSKGLKIFSRPHNTTMCGNKSIFFSKLSLCVNKVQSVKLPA